MPPRPTTEGVVATGNETDADGVQSGGWGDDLPGFI
jgi:hypothetical protein